MDILQYVSGEGHTTCNLQTYNCENVYGYTHFKGLTQNNGEKIYELLKQKIFKESSGWIFGKSGLQYCKLIFQFSPSNNHPPFE